MASTSTVTDWMQKQNFVLCLFAVVILAMLWPELGRPDYEGFAAITGNLSVALVFLLQGLSLATRQMMSGFHPVRLHVFVLGWNFVLFPALAILICVPASPFLGPELSMGLWMLAILPTTIASATALTVASRGAVPQAIFASIFSNILAIVLVPLLALTYLATANDVEVSLFSVFAKLCLIVLVPLLIGQFLRHYFRILSMAACRRTRFLPHAAILYIVYLSIAQTVASGLFEVIPLGQLALAIFAVVLMLLLGSFLVWRSSRWIGLKHEERVSAFFASSQKSIATGLPLLATIFAAVSAPVETGLVLVPLLFYHSLQLLLGGFLVPIFAGGKIKD